MVVSGTLRAVALLCLAFVSHSTLVYAGQDSTITGATKQSSGFSEPTNVKDLLDLIGKLGSFGKKDKVHEKIGESLNQRVQDYLNATKFWQKGVKKNIDVFFEKIPKLRKKMLSDPEQYGKYTNLTESDISASVNALIRWLPVLHSELWFLYFQAGKECSKFGGGEWKKQLLKGATDKTDLQKWLTSKGFKSEDLHESNVGRHIAPLTGIYLSGGPLNHAQYGLFLLSPTWHHSNLASAVLFLQVFCSNVTEKRFDKYMTGSTIEPLKPICESVSMNLKSLTNDLHPLYSGSIAKNPYKGMLKPINFIRYADWLRRNLTGIIASLHQILSESTEWTKDVLDNANSAGPFKYGFVFKDTKWESYIKEKLPPVIIELTRADSGSLSMLHKVLRPRPAQPISPGIPSQTLQFHQPTAIQPSTIAEPSTLKDVLDLLGMLGSFDKNNKVPKKLGETYDEMIQQYFDTKSIPGGNVKKIIMTQIKGIPKLRNVLLKNPKQYGKYTNLTESDISASVNALIRWLPVLHSELWFLYFQTSRGCRFISGSSWKEQLLKGATDKTDLQKWLTSKGFKSEDLHESNVGRHIAPLTGIYLSGGPLNHAQYGLMFLSPWHHSNLASAVLFLQEFCRQVEGSIFDNYMPDEKYAAVKSACESVSMNLKSLTDELHPLYSGSTDNNPYKGKLRPEAFHSYVDWLRRNLSGISTVLAGLADDSVNWNKRRMYNSESAGPFRYGFVFKDKWTPGALKEKLPPAITELTRAETGSLRGLLRRLTLMLTQAETS